LINFGHAIAIWLFRTGRESTLDHVSVIVTMDYPMKLIADNLIASGMNENASASHTMISINPLSLLIHA